MSKDAYQGQNLFRALTAVRRILPFHFTEVLEYLLPIAHDGLLKSQARPRHVIKERFVEVRIQPSVAGMTKRNQVLFDCQPPTTPRPDVMRMDFDVNMVGGGPSANPTSTRVAIENLHPQARRWGAL